MKSLFKPLIISTSLSILGLCFTISHASNEQLAHLNKQAIAESHVYVYVFPLLASEGNSQQSKNFRSIISNTESLSGGSTLIGGLLNNPLLILSKNSLSNINGSEKGKSQSFLEMSAIFNDKLLSFFAYFQNKNKVASINELANSSSVLTSNCKS